jgi:hypothetical protein
MVVSFIFVSPVVGAESEYSAFSVSFLSDDIEAPVRN